MSTRSILVRMIVSLSIAACNSEENATPVGRGPIAGARTVDWTMLGYDLASTYWNKAETKVSAESARHLTKAWEFDTKAGVTGTPVVSGGRVYVSASPVDPADPTKGGLIALDLATGAEIWRNQQAATSSSLAVDSGVLYMHDFAGYVRAFDVDDGHQLWEYDTDDNPNTIGFSSPVVTKDLVLVGGSGLEEVALPPGTPATFRGFVLALNKKTGAHAWKKYTVEPPSTGVGIWSTLSADESAGVVIAATGNNYTGAPSDTSDAFLALPLADGADFLWKQQIFEGDVFTSRQSNGNPDADFGANPILFEVEGKMLAAGGNKGGDVWVVDRSSGAIVAVGLTPDQNPSERLIGLSDKLD
jgi:outer membrane protein assembly factor BamB